MTEVQCDYPPCRMSVDGRCTAGEVVMVPSELPYPGYAAVCLGIIQQSVVPRPVIWYVDGSGTGNVVAINQAKTKKLEKFTKAKTNNEAEWEAVLLALNYVNLGCRVEIRTDSMDVVKWLDGSFKTRDVRMKDYKERVQFMIKQKRLEVTVVHVSREENLAGLFMEGKLRIE